MKVIKTKTSKEAAIEAAKIITNLVNKTPNAAIGFATGSTPLDTYKELVKDKIENGTNWSKVKTFNLDEYIGLDGSNEQSYRYFMNKNLFLDLEVEPKNIHFPENSGNLQKGCEKYDQLIKESNLDIQILGIGTNGHIAFNEPGTDFNQGTHVTKLTETTILDNSRFFDKKEDVPVEAVTMGIKTILSAKKIILLANGKSKADAIKQLVEGEMSTEWTCTALQKHDDVIVFVDEDAASKLGE